MKAVLKADDLAIGYPGKGRGTTVAEHLHFEIERGTLVGLIGSNGAGKSTLLRTLAGLQLPLRGRLELDERELTKMTASELACYRAVVLTERLPPSDLTVFELVALGRQPYTNWLGKLSQSDIKATEEALELTGATALAHKRHYEISDGQLQNVLIARAIAQQTPLVFLDEPTTHLDLPHKLALLQLLRKLVTVAGKTVIFSTHDIEQALTVCDAFLVMTADGLTFSSKDDMLRNGVLDALFASSGLRFDADRLRFEPRSS